VELEKMKLERTVSLLVLSFQAAILAAAIFHDTKIPTPTAASLGLRAFQIPTPLRPTTVFRARHPRFEADPAHRFVRDSVLKLPLWAASRSCCPLWEAFW